MSVKDILRRLWQGQTRAGRAGPPAELQRSPDELTIHAPAGASARSSSTTPDLPASGAPALPRARDELTVRTPDTPTTPIPAVDPAPPHRQAEQSEQRVVTETRETTESGDTKVVASLIAIEGELSGQSFSLYSGENQLGRSRDSNVLLPSRWISRIHARVLCEEDQMVIVPISDKLTLVNGERTEGTELADGDTVQLGRTVFRLRMVE
ncbi:MAG: FHA domain-containing protein [Proteobacteria bacterium]|nr:FHA domain-containing protein [Pseudomonadota bacterium]